MSKHKGFPYKVARINSELAFDDYVIAKFHKFEDAVAYCTLLKAVGVDTEIESLNFDEPKTMRVFISKV